MSEREDRVTVVDTGGGGGAVIVIMITTALVLLGLFFLFGEQIYSGAPQKVDVDVNLPQVQAPAKQ